MNTASVRKGGSTYVKRRQHYQAPLGNDYVATVIMVCLLPFSICKPPLGMDSLTCTGIVQKITVYLFKWLSILSHLNERVPVFQLGTCAHPTSLFSHRLPYGH